MLAVRFYVVQWLHVPVSLIFERELIHTLCMSFSIFLSYLHGNYFAYHLFEYKYFAINSTECITRINFTSTYGIENFSYRGYSHYISFNIAH